jgi:hypothetical protein
MALRTRAINTINVSVTTIINVTNSVVTEPEDTTLLATTLSKLHHHAIEAYRYATNSWVFESNCSPH